MINQGFFFEGKTIMRIWDLSPGYLNRQSLLGEHRELHGIVSIIVNKKKGYSKHPETLRWVGYGWALRMRHQLLAAEMKLRGYSEKSPVRTRAKNSAWPEQFIDTPMKQYQIINDKYQNKETGRIPIPKNAQELWRQHKYSIMARDVNLYKEIGPKVSKMKPLDDFSDLAFLFCNVLRQPPKESGLRNALLHMWGYVSEYADIDIHDVNTWSLNKLVSHVQEYALKSNNGYLLESTALSDLSVWVSY